MDEEPNEPINVQTISHEEPIEKKERTQEK